MKEISVSLWNLTEDDVKAMPVNKQILIYNTLTKRYSIKKAGANAKYMTSSPRLFYFSFNEENKNDR